MVRAWTASGLIPPSLSNPRCLIDFYTLSNVKHRSITFQVTTYDTMRRWHEKNCRHPDVVTIDSLPYCNNCYALAPPLAEVAPDVLERVPRIKPKLNGVNRPSLWWPPQIQFLDQNYPIQPTRESLPLNGSQSRDHAAAPVVHENECHNPLYNTLEVNEIRLLHLDCGEPDRVLHGEHSIVRTVDFEEPGTHEPGYDCLSCVHADPPGEIQYTEVIYLGEFWDILCISKTCAEALRHMRPQKGAQRVLWVDSICVNQYDQEEKSNQVRLMANIFSRARQVIAYLGPPCQTSSAALRWLRFIDQPQDLESTQILRKRKYGDTGLELDSPSSKDFTAFRALMGGSYFQRMWTVLESVVAQSVTLQCGSDTAPWPLAGLSQYMAILPDWIAYRKKRATIGEQELLPLLKCTAINKCDDPRDRIFSILGLIRTWDASPILPSYDLSAEEVFIGITAYIIKKHNALGIILSLASTAGSPKEGLKLPSWVPNWNNQATYRGYETPKRSIPDALTEDTLGNVQARWQFKSAETVPEVYRDFGFLQVQAILLSSSIQPFFKLIQQHGKTLPTLGSPYQTFSASWDLCREGLNTENNDQLAFVASRFVILRPTSDQNQYYDLVQTLGEDIIYSFPLSVAGINEIDFGDEDEQDETFERLQRNMFISTTGQPNNNTIASRRIKPMEKATQEQLFDLYSAVFGGSEPEHPAGTDSTSVQTLEASRARFLEVRSQLLDVALYSRLGYFREEKRLFQDFTYWIDEFRSCTSEALASIVSPGHKLEISSDSVPPGLSDQVITWAENWCLGDTLAKLDLKFCESSVSTIIKWLQSTERLLAFLSSNDFAAKRTPNTGLPGTELGKKWLLHWAGFLANTITNSESSPYPNVTPDEFIISAVLRHAVELAKVAATRIPDFEGTGLAKLPRIMGERQAISENIRVLEWVQNAFWTADIGHLSDFDQDMVVRMEMWPLGLDLDREKTIVIM